MAAVYKAGKQNGMTAEHDQVQELKKRWKEANTAAQHKVPPFSDAANGKTMEHIGTEAAQEKSHGQDFDLSMKGVVRRDSGRADDMLQKLTDNEAVQNLLEYWHQFLSQFKPASDAVQTGSGKDYLDQMYTAALEAQLENLKAAYQQNMANLDLEEAAAEDRYREQKRQSAGEAERMAANWREVANAYGLNSGAVGQAALAMNNQRQSDLNALSREQATALAEIQRQRTLLGQQYQSAINQALAENNYERANALYKEAVRLEELWGKNGAYDMGWPLGQWWSGR